MRRGRSDKSASSLGMQQSRQLRKSPAVGLTRQRDVHILSPLYYEIPITTALILDCIDTAGKKSLIASPTIWILSHLGV